MNKCPVHPDQETMVPCLGCGRYFCRICNPPSGAGQNCPRCYQESLVELKEKRARSPMLLPSGTLPKSPGVLVQTGGGRAVGSRDMDACRLTDEPQADVGICYRGFPCGCRCCLVSWSAVRGNGGAFHHSSCASVVGNRGGACTNPLPLRGDQVA